MTDEKKETVAKEDEHTKASSEATVESTADAKVGEAKAEAAPPVALKAQSVPPAAVVADAAATEAGVPKLAAPIEPVHAHHGAPHAAVNAGPGVRVRLAYQAHGAAESAPAGGRFKARRLLAEYDTTTEIIHAAETLRDAGYKAFETHTPFPVHGMDAAMGLPDSKLGWIVLLCGLTGVSSGWLMMFWMNGIDYPLIIGGKPPGTLPSMIPIMFELTVLLSAFGSVFGMLGLNRLPQHHDPLFYSDRFAAFSNDKFFLSVESEDPKFEINKTRMLLEKTKPEAIEVIETLEEVES